MQDANKSIFKEKIANDEVFELDQLTGVAIAELTEDEESEKCASAANEEAEANRGLEFTVPKDEDGSAEFGKREAGRNELFFETQISETWR